MIIRSLAITAVVLFAFSAAHAASAEGLSFAIGTCAAKPEAKARLACYDRIAKKLQAGATFAAAQPAPPSQTTTTPRGPQLQTQIAQGTVRMQPVPPPDAQPIVRTAPPAAPPTRVQPPPVVTAQAPVRTQPLPAPETQGTFPAADQGPADGAPASLAPPVTAAPAPYTPPPVVSQQPVTRAPAPRSQDHAWFDVGSWFSEDDQHATTGTPADFGAETLPPPPAADESRPEPLDHITATVMDVSFNVYGRFTVALDNGQTWRQLESDDATARFSRDTADTVTISRGALGSYNMVVENHPGMFKVRRIK